MRLRNGDQQKGTKQKTTVIPQDNYCYLTNLVFCREKRDKLSQKKLFSKSNFFCFIFLARPSWSSSGLFCVVVHLHFSAIPHIHPLTETTLLTCWWYCCCCLRTACNLRSLFPVFAVELIVGFTSLRETWNFVHGLQVLFKSFRKSLIHLYQRQERSKSKIGNRGCITTQVLRFI